MPKIVDFEKKKQEILEAAMQVFVQRGYYNTKLSDIAEHCGMGRTTLYQYFRNKDEIFKVVIQHVFEVLEQDCKSIVENINLTVTEKIKLILSKLAEECNANQSKLVIAVDLWLLLKRENDVLLNKLDNRIHILQQMFYKLLEDGISKKEIKPVNLKSMTFTLYSLVESFVLQLPYAKGVNLQEHLSNLHLFIDGLKA